MSSIGLGNPVNAQISPPGDVDWYKFEAVAGRTYVIELFNVSSSLGLEDGYNCGRRGWGLWTAISNPNLVEIGKQCYNNAGGTFQSKQSFIAGESGTYYIKVAPHEDSVSGSYSLHVLPKYDEPGAMWDETTFEPNNASANAYLITPGYEHALTSVIEQHNPIYHTEEADHDWYRFDAVEGRTYVVELFNVSSSLGLEDGYYNCGESGRGLWLLIQNPSYEKVAKQCQNTSGNNVQISTIFTAGSSGPYYIMVMPHDDSVSGSYSIRVLPKYDETGASWDSTTFEPNNRAVNAYAMTPGYTGALSSTIEQHKTENYAPVPDVDWYRFDAVEGRTYVVELFNVSSSLGLEGRGLWLLIQNPSYEEVAKQRKNTSGNNVQISTIVTAGSSGPYHIMVMPHDDSVSGSYSIRVLPKYDEPGASWDSTTFEPNNRAVNAYAMTPGYTGALSSTIEQRKAENYAPVPDVDWYRFEAVAEQTYIAELYSVSSSLGINKGDNCYWLRDRRGLWLLVLDGAFNEIAKQCDSDMSEDVTTSVEFTPGKRGVYYIGVYVQEDNVSGSYAIRVRRPQDVPPTATPIVTPSPSVTSTPELTVTVVPTTTTTPIPSEPPSIAIDPTTGKPGSRFVLSGTNFGTVTHVAIAVNGKNVANTSIISDSMTIALVTAEDAKVGIYRVTITEASSSLAADDPLASVEYTLEEAAPLREDQPEGATSVDVPVSVEPETTVPPVYLPIVVR